MQKQLSKQQQQEYTKTVAGRFNQADQASNNLCLQYYLAYKQCTSIPNDKVALAFRCAYYMAEKSQYSTNMRGEKVRNVSFSLNALLKDHKLDDTMFMLKEMIKKIKFIDEDTTAYLSNIVKEISFLITLYTKFEKTFSQKLELKERVNDGGNYARTFTSYAWLFFIIVKNQVLHRSLDLLPNTCMVAHIISTMLILAWDHLKPEGLMRGDKKLTENISTRELKRIVKEKVLQIFCIKDLNQYGKIAKDFEVYLNQLNQMNMFKMNEEKFDFLSPENIHINYKKIDKFYEKGLNMDHLDERIFLKDRAMNHTPSKLTPFARQGYANKFQKPQIGGRLGGGIQKPSKEQTFNSHRILNYDLIEKEVELKNMPIQEMKLPKKVMQSPSMVKVPFIMATPISAGMEMYNFLNEKKKKIKQFNIQERAYDKAISGMIEQVLSLESDINSKDKKQLITALYKVFSEDYLVQNPQEKQTLELQKAFLGLSAELVFFVSNITVTFEQITEQLQLQPLEMWKVISYFMTSDKSIPYSIKLRMLDLEVSLISFKMWQHMDLVKKLCNFGNKPFKETSDPENITIEKVFKRTLHQIAFQITRLASQLEIEENLSQKIFQVMKEIIVDYSDLMYRRHIDQLIMCSIYAICRNSGTYSLKFAEINEKYSTSNPNLGQLVDQIIRDVYMGEGNDRLDIIHFYNQIFIPVVKELLASKKYNSNTNLANSKISKKNSLLMSPLKAIIPKEVSYKNKNQANNKNGITPQTQLLYAYNESPILKYEVNSFKGKLKSTKVLNFEEEEQKLRDRSLEDDTPGCRPNPGPLNLNNPPPKNELIKKFTTAKTTPTNQQAQSYLNPSISQHPFQLPLQNIPKQNKTPALSSNSHRTLFDGPTDKKQYSRDTAPHMAYDDTKHKLKPAPGYQFGAYR